MHISIEHEGRSYPNVTAEQAREIGVPEEAIAAAMAEIDARTRRSEIRRDLADPPERACTIALIANDWGMSDLGRMAGAYRELFGERPSETLLAARAPKQ